MNAARAEYTFSTLASLISPDGSRLNYKGCGVGGGGGVEEEESEEILGTWSRSRSRQTMPTPTPGFQKVNYDQLDALLNISGLQSRCNPHTTKEAHQQFMAISHTLFVKEKAILPGIPEKRTNGVHACGFNNDIMTSEDSHNIGFYLNRMKIPHKLHFGSPEFIEKLQDLIKILKK
ncbi:hypothetical protein JRQ81_012875, partial [Phrynocephalus forsythii]